MHVMDRRALTYHENSKQYVKNHSIHKCFISFYSRKHYQKCFKRRANSQIALYILGKKTFLIKELSKLGVTLSCDEFLLFKGLEASPAIKNKNTKTSNLHRKIKSTFTVWLIKLILQYLLKTI